MDLCLGSLNIVCDLQKQQSDVQAWCMLLFIYPKIVYIFSLLLLLLLSPFILCSPRCLHFLTFFFSFFFILLSHFWLSSLLCPFLSRFLRILRFCSSLTPPPDWFLCLSIFSSNATRAASPPVASGAASLYTLMMRLQTGKPRKSWVKATPKRTDSAWGQGPTTVPHVIIW